MTEQLRCIVNGQIYSAWKKIRITRRLDSASGSFTLETEPQEVQATGGDLPWKIKPGDRITLDLGPVGSNLLVGYVDASEARLENGKRSLSIVGRDLTADLIDSSAPYAGGELRNHDLFDLAGYVCEPLGIIPFVEASSRAFPIFRINPGETGWQVLDRACRQRAALAFGDRNGQLRITRFESEERAPVNIIEGQNVLKAAARYRHDERFSEYLILGQANGSDESWGRETAEISGKAEDPEVLRPRRLVQVAYDPVTPESASQLAEWNAAIRAARSSRVAVTVPGWRMTPDSGPWDVGLLTRGVIPSIGVRSELRVAMVSFVMDELSRQRVDLELVRPDAYIPEPVLSFTAEPFTEQKGQGWQS